MAVKHRTLQLNISGGIYGGKVLSVNQNTSGSIYGGRLLAVNQNTDHILVGNKFYQQVQQLVGGLVILRENKLSTKIDKFIGSFSGCISLCPKNGKEITNSIWQHSRWHTHTII